MWARTIVVIIIIVLLGVFIARITYYDSPIIWAAKNGDLKTVKEEIESGVDPNQVGWGGITALHEASRYGHVAIITVLIERGADINHKDEDGFTPLQLAIVEGQTKSVKTLLEHGSMVSLLSMDLAAHSKDVRIKEMVEKKYAEILHERIETIKEEGRSTLPSNPEMPSG